MNAISILTTLTSALLVAPSVHAQTKPSVTYRLVALSGQQAPGLKDGATFFHTTFETNFITRPRIDDLGNVSLHAFLTGPGISGALGGNGITLWIDRANGGGLELVARQGQPAPGLPAGVFFEGFTSTLTPFTPFIGGGHVAFVGQLRGASIIPGLSNDAFGVWSSASGNLSLLVRSSAQAPGLPEGVLFGGTAQQPDLSGVNPFAASLINAPGHVMQGAFLTGAGVTVDNNESLWSDRSGAFNVVLREGMPAPGTTAVFGAFPSIVGPPGGLRQFNWNNQSRFALYGNLRGEGVAFPLTDEGIWAEGADGLHLIAREGDPAPGTSLVFGGIGGVGDQFAGLQFNGGGKVAFLADISPAPGSGVPDPVSGVANLWSNRFGTLQMIAGPGIDLPGGPGDGLSSAFLYSLSNTNKIALIDALPPDPGQFFSDNWGLWSDSSGTMQLVIKSGDPAPSLPAGTTIGALIISDERNFLRLADSGDIGFRVDLEGAGVTAFNDLAYYLAAPDGALNLVVREGDLFDVGALSGGEPGLDLRVVNDILPGGMNSLGEWSFKVVFNDGSIVILTARLRKSSTPGDANGDGVVDVDDLIAVILSWGSCANCSNCPADFDDNCAVDVGDLVTVILNWGQ